jgi:hypothetical protein
MPISSISGALGALQRQSTAVDRAAAKIARSGLGSKSSNPDESDRADAAAGDLLMDGVTESLVARRMFTAAVRLAQATNENIIAALRIGGYSTDDS